MNANALLVAQSEHFSELYKRDQKYGKFSYTQCQQLCDISSYCQAWTFNTLNSQCYMKQPSGWTSRDSSGAYSGFKNMGPYVQANTNFDGGDYDCTQFVES